MVDGPNIDRAVTRVKSGFAVPGSRRTQRATLWTMRAVQVTGYHEPLRIVDVPEPRIIDPNEVIVRIAGAGICRTDLHILEGNLAEAFHPSLPYTIGHENAGWIHEVGSAVHHLSPGDPVIVHPAITCGHCAACRAGDDMHCSDWRFPGVDGVDGGYAELLKTSSRSIVQLAPGTDPASLAPHADAGLTAYHAIRRLAPFTRPGSTVVIIGAGGLGHLAIQLLHALTTAAVVVIATRPERAEFARSFGADEVLMTGEDGGVAAVLEHTGGIGADAVLDLVGEGDVPGNAMRMLRKGGAYSIVGYGGRLELELLDMINRELTVLGNQIGSYTDLVELMELSRQGRVRIESQRFPLEQVSDVFDMIRGGLILGRAVLVPGGPAAGPTA
jgi:D-arabinose 1-dehydrogenase-like Zn-dependent alcohol dehydrogenase